MTTNAPIEPDQRGRYYRILRLPSASPAPSQQLALNRAHELRRFEIENYWKRSSYFWGFQIVVFAALAFTAKEGVFRPPLVLIVSALGAVTAFAATLTARGSKFWQENWETHVDLLEDEVEGKLHKTVFVRGSTGMSFSVSRVNNRLLEVLTLGWLLAFGAAAIVLIFPKLMELPPSQARWWQIIPTLVILVGSMLRIFVGQRSKVKERSYRLETMQKFR